MNLIFETSHYSHWGVQQGEFHKISDVWMYLSKTLTNSTVFNAIKTGQKMLLQTATKPNLSNFIAVLQQHFRVAESNF